MIRIGYGMFYGGEENQGGSPNRGEGVPFNETVNMSRYQGNSTYVGISQSAVPQLRFHAGRLCRWISAESVHPERGRFHARRAAGFPRLRWCTNGISSSSASCRVTWLSNSVMRATIQAHQVILWNSDPYPNLGTFNTAISSASLQEIQPACSTCQSVGNGLSMTSSFGFGNYAAASVKLEKRFSNGLQFLTSYVWSHALANGGTPLSGSSNLGPDFADQLGSSSYSSASWDIRHSFTTAFNYELPFGKGKQFGGSMNRVADWSSAAGRPTAS